MHTYSTNISKKFIHGQFCRISKNIPQAQLPSTNKRACCKNSEISYKYKMDDQIALVMKKNLKSKWNQPSCYKPEQASNSSRS